MLSDYIGFIKEVAIRYSLDFYYFIVYLEEKYAPVLRKMSGEGAKKFIEETGKKLAEIRDKAIKLRKKVEGT